MVNCAKFIDVFLNIKNITVHESLPNPTLSNRYPTNTLCSWNIHPNKQIHGNYAHEDRMVIQSHWLGQLAAQFHKWIVPAYDARFRRAYFDENMGWLEGRYITLWNYMGYLYQIKNG